MLAITTAVHERAAFAGSAAAAGREVYFKRELVISDKYGVPRYIIIGYLQGVHVYIYMYIRDVGPS